jgi:glycosyltransferase involved in cell wall biosynthesis
LHIGLALLTYNEIDGVRALFDKIPFGAVDEAFAVDGGSTDGTLEFFRDKNFPVVQQHSPKGRGEAFRLAFNNTSSDALIFFSPDGNEDPNDIATFRPFLEQGYHIVTASRMMKGAHNEEDDQLFKWRKWANNIFNLMANLTWNRGNKFITDAINGYRAITKKAWDQLRLDAMDYFIEYQSTIRAFKLGLRIIEFPTHEGSRIGGESYARSLHTGLRFLKGYLHELWIGRQFALSRGNQENKK